MNFPISYINNNELIYRHSLNTIRGTLTGVHISDIHFGIINPKTQYEILRKQFLDKIRDIHFDLVSINGDLFDHKFMSNSDVVLYCSLFISELVDICRRKQATLIMVHGTEYHDANQLKIFYHYLNDRSVDVRIVEEAKFEYVKGAKVLCIPELYNKGADYYNNLLHESLYDGVFMHGVIKGAIFEAKNQESGIHSEKAPTFTMDNFCHCRGPIISGHVHVANCFEKYFYYCGSPIRWQFGEEQPKGFIVLLHNLDSQEHFMHFEEIQSFRYDTINLSHMITGDPSRIIDYVNSLQDIDYIRLEFGDVPQEAFANLDIVKKYYKNISRVKFKVSNTRLEAHIKNTNEFLENFKEYDYVLDKSLNEYDILSRFINQQKGHDYISVEELKQIVEEATM